MTPTAERSLYDKRMETLESFGGARKQSIIQVYTDVSMRKGHPGLGAIASDDGHDPQRLGPGQYLVFINTKCTAFKMFAPNNVVAHHKVPKGAGTLDMRTIALLPKCFNGAAIDYNKAIKEVLLKSLKLSN